MFHLFFMNKSIHGHPNVFLLTPVRFPASILNIAFFFLQWIVRVLINYVKTDYTKQGQQKTIAPNYVDSSRQNGQCFLGLTF